MYFILFIILVCAVYIKSFKEDFTEEHINKVAPVLVVLAIIIIIPSLLASILRR